VQIKRLEVGTTGQLLLSLALFFYNNPILSEATFYLISLCFKFPFAYTICFKQTQSIYVLGFFMPII